MTKFIDTLDMQIRLHLAVRYFLAIVVYNSGKFLINNKLAEWYKLSWEELLEELKSAGISTSIVSGKPYVRKAFEEQKSKVLFIIEEINRHDEIISNNKIRI